MTALAAHGFDAEAKRAAKPRARAESVLPPPAPVVAPTPVPTSSKPAAVLASGVLALMGAAFFMLRRRKPAVSSAMVVLGAEGTPALPARLFGAAHTAPYPFGFEIEPFLRHARDSFIRLQAAHDSAHLDLMRDYTTSEMFAELKNQVEARG
ncbi:MAG: hypothetical protein ACREUV_03190, partial [Burkholderiales bacterium]